MRSSPTAAAAFSASSTSPLEHLPLIGGVRPHAGVAVRLELQPDRELVRLGWIRLLELPHARVRAQQVLDVVPELVGEHVRLREIARRAEPLLQLVEEAEIEVDPLVERTVERTHHRLGGAAPGISRVRNNTSLAG